GVAVPAYPEERPRDRRAALPGADGTAGWEIEGLAPARSLAERVLHVHPPGIYAEQRPRAMRGDVAEHEPDTHAAIRDGALVAEHRARDHPLPALERQPEQEPRDARGGRLLARGHHVHAYRKEQVAPVRIPQVEVVQERLRELAGTRVHDVHPIAPNRAAYGD